MAIKRDLIRITTKGSNIFSSPSKSHCLIFESHITRNDFVSGARVSQRTQSKIGLHDYYLFVHKVLRTLHGVRAEYESSTKNVHYHGYIVPWFQVLQ